jgi:hypothetical protein
MELGEGLEAVEGYLSIDCELLYCPSLANYSRDVMVRR